MSTVDIFAFQRRGVSGWEPDETHIETPKWGAPEDLAVKQLDKRVQDVLAAGESVEEYDGVIRVLMWAHEEPRAARSALPTRWPDAMVVWHKPDTSILDAAVKAAAPYYAPFLAQPRELQAALRVVKAVLEAHDERVGRISRISAADMVSLAAALLPDHR